MNKVMKILVGVMVFAVRLSLMAEDSAGVVLSGQGVRLGFCELMNAEGGRAESQSIASSLMVLDVWSRPNMPFCHRYGYSMGYAALVVENTSDKDVLLPDIHSWEWSIRKPGSSRDIKSLPYMSSHGERPNISLCPFQRVAYVYGNDGILADCMRTGLVARCHVYKGSLTGIKLSAEFSLVSNALSAPWLPEGISGEGLCLNVVEIGAFQFGKYAPMTLLLPNQTKPEAISSSSEVEEACAVLLLSNTSQTNIVVRGFSTSAWSVEAQDGESRRSVKIADYVARPYLKDFELARGCTKALALGAPFRPEQGKRVKFIVRYKGLCVGAVGPP